MKYLFEIDRTVNGLGEEEVKSLVGVGKRLSKRFLVSEEEIEKRDIERFGMVTAVYEIILCSNEEDFLQRIKDVEWKRYYNGDFSLRKHEVKKPSLEESKIADEVWLALRVQGLDPKSNLKSPSTRLTAIKEGEKTLLCKRIWKRANFEDRRPDKRPALHPSSMHPKIARALINISGVKKGYLIDPFCGSGGILIEAALLGYKVKGIDIDGAMLGRAKKNLDFYDLSVELEKKDSRKLKEECDLIVTDPPYGKNTKKTGDIKRLYIDFLKNAKNRCSVIIMVFPAFLDVEEIAKRSGIKIEKSWTQYLHKSLSRVICRLASSSS